MRYAFMLMGIATLILTVGAFLVFEKKAAAPTQTDDVNSPPMTLTLTSSAFKNGETIPSKYTCDGDNVIPELIIDGVPPETVSLVLLMDDPDIPDVVKERIGADAFDHLVLYNIPPETTRIGEGETLGTEGLNSRGTPGYTGPCPPDREHRYFFRLYALSGTLNFIKAPTLREVEEAAKSMSLGEATYTGRYERISN